MSADENETPMDVRETEEWKSAQADYVADYPDLDPDERFRRRAAAAARMHSLETGH